MKCNIVHVERSTAERRLTSLTRNDRTKAFRTLPKPWNKLFSRLIYECEFDVKDLPEWTSTHHALLQELTLSYVLHRKDMVETETYNKWRDSDRWKDFMMKLIDLKDKSRVKRLHRNIFKSISSILEEKVQDEPFRQQLLSSIVKRLSEDLEE